MKTSHAAAVAVALLIAACGAEPPPPEPAPPQGRAETRAIRNTEAVGYSGGAIADKVDGALNANDQHVKQVEQQSQQDSNPAE